MPAGRSLLGPIDAALRPSRHWLPVKSNKALCSTLSDFSILLCILTSRPSHCHELVIHKPGYIGFCDASSLGTGGVWFDGACPMPPTVWHIQWPNDIRQSVISFNNPSGFLTNSDLEMAGMLLLYLVLEHLATLRHIHVAAWCDNTPTVAWMNKLSASHSPIAGQLMQALAMCIHMNKASPLTSHSIAGIDNKLADMATRTFHRNTATHKTFAIPDDNFLHLFNSTFPLQNNSWCSFCLSSKLTLLVFSELRGKASMLASWQ